MENFNNKKISRPKIEKKFKDFFSCEKLSKKLEILKKEEKNDLNSIFKIFLNSYEFINQANQHKNLKFPSNFEMKNILEKEKKSFLGKNKKNNFLEKENERSRFLNENLDRIKNFFFEILKKENNFYFTILKVFDFIKNKEIKNLLKKNLEFISQKKNLEENSELIKNEAILRTKEMIEKVELVMEENSILTSELKNLKKNGKDEKKLFLKELKKLEKENVDIKTTKTNKIKKSKNLKKEKTLEFDNEKINRNFEIDKKENSFEKKKNLNFKKMKILISEIFESKIEFNKKCLKSKIKFESLKTYLNIFFKNKFGLEKIKNESLNNFLLSLENFIFQDSDSYVFYSILNFDIDEEFFFIHREIQKTLKKSLQTFLRKKNRMKNDKFINDLINKKLSNKIPLEKNEIIFLVKEIIGNEDCENITKDIFTNDNNFINKKIISSEKTIITKKKKTSSQKYINKNKKISTEKKNINKNKNFYSNYFFQNLEYKICSYFLNKHKTLLFGIKSVFKKFDKKKNGILTKVF